MSFQFRPALLFPARRIARSKTKKSAPALAGADPNCERPAADYGVDRRLGVGAFS
jgi:hypothetical protein